MDQATADGESLPCAVSRSGRRKVVPEDPWAALGLDLDARSRWIKAGVHSPDLVRDCLEHGLSAVDMDAAFLGSTVKEQLLSGLDPALIAFLLRNSKPA